MNPMAKTMNSRKNQTGAALYVSLIILILMTLIGVVAMQVAGLQERMSANYQASNMALQNAESDARTQENELEDAVADGLNPPTDIPPMDCEAAFDPEIYAVVDDPHVRRLDMCFSWTALDVPSDEAERTDQIYQITVYSQDREAALFPSSEAVIDTVFIP
jgi:type IV pilus assembly protein PilX